MVPLIDPTIKFDAFAEEHECLQSTLTEMRMLLSERGNPGLAIETLADLAGHVVTHFVHEEQDDGFFDNVVEQAPRLQSKAAELIEEHATMIDALTGMQIFAAKNEPSEAWWKDLAARFEAFWLSFSRHERAEIDMVQEAFNEDIGPAD